MDHFKEQLKEVKPISEDILVNLKGKYYSGREYKIGDKVLYGLLMKNNEDMEVITLHEDEISNYEIVQDQCIKDNIIPVIKEK
jgi:hypothetical protein